MKYALRICLLVICASLFLSTVSCRFMKQAAQGSQDMRRSDKPCPACLNIWKRAAEYLPARGNYDAAQRGPDEKWAAEKISNAS